MKLDYESALLRLTANDHGTFCTLHNDRGVDAVPAVYAIDINGFLGIPIDRVKPKASTKLQRKSNLEFDKRATLLVDHWDKVDWSQLWWVRAHLEWQGNSAKDKADALSGLLAKKYAQYKDEPFERVLVFRITSLTGWAASED